MDSSELRQHCHTFVSGHRPGTAAKDFAAMAQWCEANQVSHDTYGEGLLIQAFEQKIADLLGFEGAVFMITGTMAQTIALRLACEERGSALVAMHPTAHILRHEHSNYQVFDDFKVLQIGGPHRPWTCDQLKAMPDRLGAVLCELPMREIGGQLPAWDELAAIKAHCRERGAHLHMDGARLWEAAAWYQRDWKEIAHGFDSVYVSFYKGIGGLGGAMLLGGRDFIAKATVAMKRQGGNVIHRSPYAVSAAMQFDQRLAAMSGYFRRTEWLYALLTEFPQWQVNPARPQANMLHVYFPVSRDRLLTIRDELAQEHGVWLFGGAHDAPLPGQSYIEWYVGDNLLALADQRVRELLVLLDEKCGRTGVRG